mmetsp:Transcript_26790/g.40247  ORF Transcript_26790/g.40247 Transcript_26790/m.40247 type:complete len:189 (-) Transcript_26790:1529-2095(-)
MSGALAAVREKASLGLNKAKSAVGITKTPEPENTNALDDMAEFCPQLTYKQRVYGFAVCFGIGYLITIMSFNFFDELRDNGNPVPFVIFYTLGNVISLLASMFLCGFKTQFKRMFDDTRKVTTIVYLSTLVASIIICFIPFNPDLKLLILVLLLIAQFIASTWYTLSYIPFARRAVKKCFKREFGDEA